MNGLNDLGKSGLMIYHVALSKRGVTFVNTFDIFFSWVREFLCMGLAMMISCNIKKGFQIHDVLLIQPLIHFHPAFTGRNCIASSSSSTTIIFV